MGMRRDFMVPDKAVLGGIQKLLGGHETLMRAWWDIARARGRQSSVLPRDMGHALHQVVR